MTEMMGCGHAANAKTADGKPCCAVCVGIHAESRTVVEAPDLAGRTAWCSYHSGCKQERPSSPDLAFFEYRKNESVDRFYCGCYGWD